MKKIYCVLIVLMSIFIFSACAAKEETTTLDFDFSEYFGLTMDEYFETANVSRESVVEGLSGTGMYCFVETVPYNDIEFTKFLSVDVTANVIYGGGYQYLVENPDESTLELVKEIKQNLAETFGEPTTYEGLDNRLSDMKTFSDITAKGNAVERWTVVGEAPLLIPAYEGIEMIEEIELDISSSNGNAVIKIVHQLRAER